MARKKVKLAWIANDAARRATYKKRKKGLLKKVSELSTLCGVEACAVVTSAYEQQPEVWPSAADAHRVLLKFKTLPEMDQGKKMMTQEGFFRQRIEKLKEQAKKWGKESREQEVEALLYDCLSGVKALEDLNAGGLDELLTRLDAVAKAVHERMEASKRAANGGKGSSHQSSSSSSSSIALQAALEALQRQQQWLVEVMNPPLDHQAAAAASAVRDHNNCTATDQMVNPFPFVDASSWFDAFMGDL